MKVEKKLIESDTIKSLFEGMDLTEDFFTKVEVIFEGAVSEKVSEILESEKLKLEEKHEEYKKELEEQLGDYIDMFSLNYLKENALAIENGVKAEIAESLISSLKNVFFEHNIDIPDGEVSVVESLSERVSELQEQLDLQIKENVTLSKNNQKATMTKILEEETSDLDKVTASKIEKMVEHINFQDEKTFRETIKTFKESLSYRTSNKTNLDEEVNINSKNINGSSRDVFLELIKE